MRWHIIFFIFAIGNGETKAIRNWQKKFIIKKRHPEKNRGKSSIDNVQEDTIKKCSDVQNAMSAVTYELNGGRFGDNLSSYCRAMWLSYYYNMPLLYKLFTHAKQLALDQHGSLMTKGIVRKFKRKFTIPPYNHYKIDRMSGFLYTVAWKSKISVDWNDQHFKSLLKKCIAFHTPSTIKIPENHISVAVHIRTGGDYTPDKRIRFKQPKRFIAKQFYIDQIKRIGDMFKGKNLYVHIFTDDSNPQALIKDFKKDIDGHVRFGCRMKGNNHRQHVLEDFFAMTTFDCLIRPESLYSIYAERLGNHKIVIYPVHVSAAGYRKKYAVREIAIKKKELDGYTMERIRV